MGVGPISLHDGTDSLLGGPLGLHDADALVVVVNANAEGDLDVVLADDVLVEAGEDLLRGGEPTLLGRLTGEVGIAAVLFLVRFLSRWLLLLLLLMSAHVGSKSIAGERIAIGPHLGIVVADMLHENIRLLLLDAPTSASTSGTGGDGVLHDEPTAAGGAVEVVLVGKVVRMEDNDGRAARTAMTSGTAWAAWTSASTSRSGMRRWAEATTDAMHGRTAMSSGGRGGRRRGNLVEILASGIGTDTRILRWMTTKTGKRIRLRRARRSRRNRMPGQGEVRPISAPATIPPLYRECPRSKNMSEQPLLRLSLSRRPTHVHGLPKLFCILC